MNNKEEYFWKDCQSLKIIFRLSEKRAQNPSSLHWRDVEALKDLSDCDTTNMGSLEAGAALSTILLVL